MSVVTLGRGRFLRGDDLAADAFGDQVDVEDRVRAHHVDVAVDALELVVEVVHRRAARLHDLAHDVAALLDDVRDAEAQVQLAEQVEIDATVGSGPACDRAMSRISVSAKSTSTRRLASRTCVGTRALCVRLVPNITRSNRRSSNSARARLAAPIAGMAAVSERNGAIGIR